MRRNVSLFYISLYLHLTHRKCNDAVARDTRAQASDTCKVKRRRKSSEPTSGEFIARIITYISFVRACNRIYICIYIGARENAGERNIGGTRESIASSRHR